MKRKSESKSKKKTNWFTSTIKVLLIVFIICSSLGIYLFGWRRVLDESLIYIIGASFTGLMITLIGILNKANKIKLW